MQLNHYRHDFHAMGSACEVQVYAQDKATAEAVFNAVTSRVNDIELKYSRYRADSMLSRINQGAAAAAVTVDDDTADLLDYAEHCFTQSGGLFDITSGILRRAWDFKAGKIPSAEQINELLPLIGWQHVEWKRPKIRFCKPQMEIDLGGIGKEYAVDLACGELTRRYIKHALVNLGGDVRSVGGQPDKRPWTIGVVHPRHPGETAATVVLENGALATSGDYERFFELDGKRYCHILNPKSGRPVESFQSVTVISDSCLAAGTLSTITMLMGEAKGLEFLQSSGLRFICVGSDGQVIS